jgi:hypothetical protein
MPSGWIRQISTRQELTAVTLFASLSAPYLLYNSPNIRDVSERQAATRRITMKARVFLRIAAEMWQILDLSGIRHGTSSRSILVRLPGCGAALGATT